MSPLDNRKWRACNRGIGHSGPCAHGRRRKTYNLKEERQRREDEGMAYTRLCAIVCLAKRVADDYDEWKAGDSEKRMDFEMNMLALQAQTQGIDLKKDLGIDELHVIQADADDTATDEDEV